MEENSNLTMTLQNVDSLPLILVSAKDEASATSLINEIIDNVPEDITCDSKTQNTNNKVWRIKNKYYTADVRLHPLGDHQELDPRLEELIEAHVIYLSPEEVSADDERALRARAGRVRDTGGVRLAALDGGHEPAALAAAALAARLEPVPLRHRGRHRGLPRLRDALHAHVWPTAPTTPGRPHHDHDHDDGSSDDDDDWGPWCAGESPAEGGERAFAAALGALPAAAAAARATQSRAQRLAAAEHVLAAFCRALSLPPP